MDAKRIHLDDLCLPFPIALQLQESILWPLNEPGHLLITSALDELQNVVTVRDSGAIITLMKTGFFGLNSNKELQVLHCRTAPDFNKVSKFTVGSYVLVDVEIPDAKVKFEQDMSIEKPVETPSERVVEELCFRLSLEESYFLAYAFGVLRVSKNSDESTEYYNLEELWSKFCALSADFPVRYAAYHHFRSKGWIVRSGFKFGVNYLLYQEGPAFNHATYSVLFDTNRDLNWQQLSGMIRLSRNAGKELLLCNVVVPDNLSFTTPEAIKNCAIQLFHVSRTLPTDFNEDQNS